MNNRFVTRTVFVGPVALGGNHAIRIQSMTSTPTRDTEKTVNQIMRLADSGCELVRVAVQGKLEAICCETIKNKLVQSGYLIPLIADIHFYPPAAMMVLPFVDKIRVNPGNFVEKRNNDTRLDQEKLEENFLPLVLECKRLKKVLRIGANHGSLSDRIMNLFGNTPRGMVESAFEFARLCQSQDFHDFVFSMKSSHPIVMIDAYRLLVSEMERLHWDYPIHLGVTESGSGEEGRVKSALGIGTLLMEGIGDTIRVSLTEDPVNEIAVCREMLSFLKNQKRERFVFQKRSKRTECVVVGAKDSPSTPAVDVKMSDWMKDSLTICEGLYSQTNSHFKRIFLQPSHSPLQEVRCFVDDMEKKNVQLPVILLRSYAGTWDRVLIHASMELGAILLERLVDGICIQSDHEASDLSRLSFLLLQASRIRMTRADYISCPGCGRTLFDIVSLTIAVKERTKHLSGVKIAIMGCIVNGPGEMADADFGLMGSKPNRVNLFEKQECVAKDVPIEEACDRLMELILSRNVTRLNPY